MTELSPESIAKLAEEIAEATHRLRLLKKEWRSIAPNVSRKMNRELLQEGCLTATKVQFLMDSNRDL